MSSTIFLVDGANTLTELHRTEYASEGLLQRLLADHPAVLGAVSSDNRLLLISREFGVPGEESSADRWSLDHLFLDREGVPILVEVKRSTDTRARREVVAQMLDYAANGVAYWPLEQIVSSFRETASASGRDADAVLREFLGTQPTEAYWRQVEANLRSGRIRMIFVADKIAKELRRIVEFLNEQMRPAEVVAIEVEQFVGSNGVRTLVPRLLGDTERAQAVKSVETLRPAVSEADWLGQLGEAKGEAARLAAARLLAWFQQNGFVTGVTESRDAMFARLSRPDGKASWPFFIRKSSGKVELSLQYLQANPSFASEQSRERLLERMRASFGPSITTTKLTGWPAVPLDEIQRDDAWRALVTIALDVKKHVESGEAF